MAETILQAARLALRRTTETFDTEITGLIHAATDDMRRRGITVSGDVSESAEVSKINPLTVRAIMLYAKANFGMDGDIEQQKRFEALYEHLTAGLAMRHTAEDVTGDE